MKVTPRRWYSVFLLRDALGRFASLRGPVLKPRLVRRAHRPRVRLDGVQLALS